MTQNPPPTDPTPDPQPVTTTGTGAPASTPPPTVPSTPSAPASTPEGWSARPDTLAATRPSGVTTASLLLAVLGVVSLLMGAALLLISNAADQYLRPANVNPDAFGAGASLTGIFYIVFGILQLAAAVLAWGGRELGRILGIAAGVIGLLVAIAGLLGLLATSATVADRTVGLVVWIVVVLAYALTVYALYRHSEWFTARRVVRT